MYKVILAAEDGEYVKFECSTREAAEQWVKDNEDRYGEGQSLYIEKQNGCPY